MQLGTLGRRRPEHVRTQHVQQTVQQPVHPVQLSLSIQQLAFIDDDNDDQDVGTAAERTPPWLFIFGSKKQQTIGMFIQIFTVP